MKVPRDIYYVNHASILQELSVQVEKSMSDLLNRIAKLHDSSSKLGFISKEMDDEAKTRSLTENERYPNALWTFSPK